MFLILPKPIHSLRSRRHTNQFETDFCEYVHIISVRQVEIVFKGCWIDIIVAQLFTQLFAAVLVNPDCQQLIDTLCRYIKNKLARLFGVVLKWDFTTINDAEAPIRDFFQAGFGVVPGQKVFTMDPYQGVVLYAAWWPWGDDERISLRLGLVSVSGEKLERKDVKSLICRWLNLE